MPRIQKIGDLHPLMTIHDFGIKGRLITNPDLRTNARTGEKFLPVTLQDWSGLMRVIFKGKKAIEYVDLMNLFNFVSIFFPYSKNEFVNFFIGL